MIVYGRRPVEEAVRGRRKVRRIWVADAAALGRLQATSALGSIPVIRTSARELEELCGSRDHQGAVTEVSEYEYAARAEDLYRDENSVVVALDGVQDPQNLGAVARVAEVAGASGLVIPKHRAAQVTPAVCKASAGAVEHLKIARVVNLAKSAADARKAGVWVYGTGLGAGVDYRDIDWSGRLIVVFGAEGRGLRPGVCRSCDEMVTIPSDGSIGSLNVATASAVVLFEIARQRRSG